MIKASQPRSQRAFAALFAALLVLVCPRPGAAATPAALADLVEPRTKLDYFEVFHVDTMTESRSAMRFANLLNRDYVDSYVRVRANAIGSGDPAVGELYRALQLSVIQEQPCRRPDLRWAVVLTYTDGRREAFGFGQFLDCVAVMSTGANFTVSPGLYEFVLRTFPFMR